MTDKTYVVTLFSSFPQSLTDCINDGHTVPHSSAHGCVHDAAGLAFCLPGLSGPIRDHRRTPVPLEEVGALLCRCVSVYLKVNFVFKEALSLSQTSNIFTFDISNGRMVWAAIQSTMLLSV